MQINIQLKNCVIKMFKKCNAAQRADVELFNILGVVFFTQGKSGRNKLKAASSSSEPTCETQRKSLSARVHLSASER